MQDRSDRRRLRPPGRRIWTLAAAVAVVTAVVVAPGAVGAQEGRPAWVNGDAKASANLFDFKVQITGAVGGDGGLAIGFGSGRALTTSQDTSANAEGRALDYSLMSLLNRQPTPECPDIIPLYLNSTAPPVTLAENSDPADAASQLTNIRYAGFPTQGSEFGTQDATAGPGITAHATTTAMLVDSGVVKLANPRSESTTRIVNGVREAVAVSTADSLSVMGGAMTLFKPTWTATSRSGSTTTNEASFTYSSAIVLGLSRPGGNTADLQAFKGFVESTFSGLGLKLILPEAAAVPGPNGTGTVSISPLRVGIENIPLGSQLLRPILRALTPTIDQAIESALKVECADPGLRLVADIVMGIASGTGGLSFAVGGADAMTDDIYYPPVNFDSGIGGSLDAAPALGAATFDTGSLGTGVLGADLTSSSGIAPLGSDTLTTDTLPLDTPVTTEAEVGDEETAADREVATVRRAAQSTPGNTGGTAGWVTLLGLGAVVALVIGDQLVMRRSRRKFAS